MSKIGYDYIKISKVLSSRNYDGEWDFMFHSPNSMINAYFASSKEISKREACEIVIKHMKITVAIMIYLKENTYAKAIDISELERLSDKIQNTMFEYAVSLVMQHITINEKGIVSHENNC